MRQVEIPRRIGRGVWVRCENYLGADVEDVPEPCVDPIELCGLGLWLFAEPWLDEVFDEPWLDMELDGSGLANALDEPWPGIPPCPWMFNADSVC
jgi:hypothetical protein